jgi:predicted N-acyltransferase
MLGEAMGDSVMLAVAYEGDELVAGALNLVGSHAVYGRNWGCLPGREYKHLHFELCYYQALEEAIARRLPRVEAGAQGEHKLQVRAAGALGGAGAGSAP